MSEYQKVFREQVEAPKNSRHHITPSSRTSKKKARKYRNIAFVNEELHSKLHSLFLNRTPEEILDFLVNYFWGGRTDFLKDYLERREL